MHNVSEVHAYGDTGADATLYDAPLSARGQQQAAGLDGNAALLEAELVLVSPLTRASGRCCQAKTTKKITLKLTCSACKAVRLKPIKRAKHFEICDKKPKTKGQMY